MMTCRSALRGSTVSWKLTVAAEPGVLAVTVTSPAEPPALSDGAVACPVALVLTVADPSPLGNDAEPPATVKVTGTCPIGTPVSSTSTAYCNA